MKIDWVMSWVMLATIGLSGCSSTPAPAPADTPPPQAAAEPEAEPEPVEMHRDGRYIVSAQPDESALRSLADEGVGTVISCRSVEEMDGLDFDQEALLAELGLAYVHVPMGRDHGYEPGQVAAFTEAVRSIEGPVYVHCASGGRARYLIIGHLVREQGYSIDDAFDVIVRLGGSRPSLERLMGERISYQLTGVPLTEAEME